MPRCMQGDRRGGVIEPTRGVPVFKESDPLEVPPLKYRIRDSTFGPSPSSPNRIMDFYPLAKYTHLVALFVAAGVTAVTKLAAGRRMRARTVGEALEWHTVLMSAATLFPICLLVLAITGG